MSTPDDDDDVAACATCGAVAEWETCWECHGEGGFHDCGEDTCVCLDKDAVTEECETCGGMGGYWACPNAERHRAIRTTTEPR